MKYNRGKTIAIVIIVIIAVIIVAVSIGRMNRTSENVMDEGQNIEDLEDNSEDNNSDEGLTAEVQGTDVDSDKTHNIETNKDKTQMDLPGSDNTTEIEMIKLPYAIPNTNLVINKLASYDGKYFEDGTDVDVSNVATIVLTNTGVEEIEYTEVYIVCDNQTLTFSASAIPSGKSVVVQEKNQLNYAGGNCMSCQAEVALLDKFDMSEDKVKIEENEDDSFAITNLLTEDIPCVRVFYKLYMADEDVYVGGITYTVKITDLKAGETRNVLPSHYINGYSEIMMVRVYDSAD